MKLVTVQEMKDIERAADRAGLPYAEMMERAGGAVAQAVICRCESSGRVILVLVGPGNNGGDGLVAGRILADAGHEVHVYLWKRPEMGDDEHLAQVSQAGATIHSHSSDPSLNTLNDIATRADVIIDALLGTGAKGALRDGAGEILTTISTAVSQRRALPGRTPCPVGYAPGGCQPAKVPLIVAVDVPSGLDADTGEIDPRALHADICITFAYPKRGHFIFPGAAHVGELFVANLGTQEQLADAVQSSVVTDREIQSRLGARPPDAHKGSFGKVMVVAGSSNYVGAPALAARAAYRSGAGLVTLATPGPLHTALASHLPEATYLTLPSDMGVIAPPAVSLLADSLPGYDVLLLGPGLTQEEPARGFVRTLLERHEKSASKAIGFIRPAREEREAITLPATVIDADGLNLLAGIPSWPALLPERTVLTPHPGEMARLLSDDPLAGERDRVLVAATAAEKWGCTVVLKGAYTVVASPGHDAEVIPFAEAALATAGTGDVLAGTVAGLLAQGLSCHDAAVCGAYVHGLAGVLWARDHGHAGMLAGDLADLLPIARRAITGD